MNKQDLETALGQVREEYIEEAAPRSAAAAARKTRWIRWAAAAACFGLVLTAGLLFWPKQQQKPLLDLPTIPVIYDTVPEAFGFEGYMAYDSAELVSASPVGSDLAAETLPVYSNPLADGDDTPDLARMEAILLDTARRLGLEADSTMVTDNSPDQAERQQIEEKFAAVGESVPEEYFVPTRLMLQQGDITMEIDPDLTVVIGFEPAIALPEGLTLDHYATRQQKEQAAVWLMEQYGALLDTQDLRWGLSGGDYDIYGRQQYQIEFYPGAEQEDALFAGYSFERALFYGDDEGRLFLIRMYHTDRSQKLGDYPIIDAEQAGKLLQQGSYFTSVPVDFPGMQQVAKVEIVYRTGSGECYFFPCYRFYVELPEMQEENGLKHYGAYYVPAVDPAYLTEEVIWVGA